MRSRRGPTFCDCVVCNSNPGVTGTVRDSEDRLSPLSVARARATGPLLSSPHSTPWLHRARATPPVWDSTRMASTTTSDNSSHRYTWIVQGLSWIFSRVFSSCTEPPIESRHKVAAAHRDVSPQAATSGLPHRTPLHSSGRICSP